MRLDLLSDKNQDMTLEQVFKFIEAKKVGKCSTTPPSTTAQRCTLKEHIPLRRQPRRAMHLTTGNKQPEPGMKLAHTVKKQGIEPVNQCGCKGRSTWRMASNANSAVVTTTLSRYEGTNLPP